MRKSIALFLSSTALLIIQALPLPAANPAQKPTVNAPTGTSTNQSASAQGTETPSVPFNAFTGKITKNKVRLRIQPSLDGPILKELNQGDMLIITGESDDFYSVQSPAGVKAYIFRTYVLDNTVEATRVNIRLEPDLDAPVIGQMHAGDHVEGVISPINSKWLEIAPPASSRFYVAKDYVENIGAPAMMAKIEKRRDDVNMLLNSTYVASQQEMQKPFPEINLDTIYANLNKVVNDYKDFPEQVARARELLSGIQDAYLQQKIVFLETKTKSVQEDWQAKASQLSEQMKSQQQKMSMMERQLNHSGDSKMGETGKGSAPVGMSSKIAAWLPAENSLYDAWLQSNPGKSQDEFYGEESTQAVALKGVVEPYNRVVKNKPGDYILVNPASHLPIAYIYSTHTNLQDLVGHEVTIYGSPRDNHNFAFPAYYILSVEQ
ncbi:MAG: SH3 domain-containing protein [Parachlamydiaceae bacterium]